MENSAGGIRAFCQNQEVFFRVSLAIVSRIATQLHVRPYVSITPYGCAINAFKLGAGLVLNNKPLEKTLIVLDGDRYTSRAERVERVAAELTGTEIFRPAQRKSLLKVIRPFRAKARQTPESALNEMLRSLDPEQVDEDLRVLLDIASGVIRMPHDHGLINNVVEQTGESREVVLNQLALLASKSSRWEQYTRSVRLALESMRDALNIDPQA